MAPTFASVRDVIRRAIAERATPSAVAEVGTSRHPIWREAFGRLAYAEDAPAASEETIYDLASLTKVLATTPLVMRHVERGALGLDDAVARHIAAWRGGDRSNVTLRDLLSHCSGLPAYLPFHRTLHGRTAFEAAITATPLEYSPRTKALYSDPGFILLGFVLENHAPLPAQFDAMRQQMGISEEIQFHPPALWRPRTAPTRHDDWRGRLLIGEVDDNNAYALGGAAAHAGLFGTVSAVGQCARHVLQVLDGRTGAFRSDTLRTFIARRTDVPGSSRALGWDTMLPTSSCGTRMSPRAFGHTGFSGTSLWIDPDRDLYVALLTNRIHPAPSSGDAIRALRRAVHDAVIDALA